MSAATRLARLFDRRFVAGLAVLAGVCVVVALLWGHNVAAMGDGTLSGAYGQVVNYSLATFVYVPICAFSAAGAMRPVASAVWVIRSSRGRTLLAVMGRLVVRALALSALLTLCGLVSVRLLSPTGHAAGACVAFGLLAALRLSHFCRVGCTSYCLAVRPHRLRVPMRYSGARMRCINSLAVGRHSIILRFGWIKPYDSDARMILICGASGVYYARVPPAMHLNK